MDPQNCNFKSHQRMSSFLSISDSKHVAEWSSEGHSLHERMSSDTPAGFLESLESAFTMLYDSWRRQICGLVCFKRNWTQPSMILIITLCLYQKKKTYFWLVVKQPLWTIWVSQLGWWHSQDMESHNPVMFQTTNQILMNISMVFDTARAVKNGTRPSVVGTLRSL